MSVLSCGSTVEVFKFDSTGLVALCEEIALYVSQGDGANNLLRDCDLDSAEYEHREDMHVIRFKRKI